MRVVDDGTNLVALNAVTRKAPEEGYPLTCSFGFLNNIREFAENLIEGSVIEVLVDFNFFLFGSH